MDPLTPEEALTLINLLKCRTGTIYVQVLSLPLTRAQKAAFRHMYDRSVEKYHERTIPQWYYENLASCLSKATQRREDEDRLQANTETTRERARPARAQGAR